MLDVYSSARMVSAEGVSLRVTDHGPEDGEGVLMVHGWPDTAHVWRNQIADLVDRGYRVLAPDMRGRGGSTKPDLVEDNRMGQIVLDLLTILDDAGLEQAHVVGHDWGALASWTLAIRHPMRVRSLVALSVGHPSAFLSGGLEQLMRSWYMLLFQFEGVAEEWLSRDDWANFRRFAGNHPETEAWIRELEKDGALEASLNWYRANVPPQRLLRKPRQLPPVTVPSLGIWSSRDFALTESQMSNSGSYVEAEWAYQRLDGLSHWMQLDDPDLLNSLIADWILSH